MDHQKILCTGDRNWDKPRIEDPDYWVKNTTYLARQKTVSNALIWTQNNILSDIPKIMVIHGGARGVDRLCGEAAVALNYEVSVYVAEWDIYGPGAGPIRNRKMLDENPDIKIVLAFHDDIMKSRGTLHMSRYAASKGYQVLVYNTKGARAEFHNYGTKDAAVFGKL